jgi:hypothetical protein
MTMRPTAATMIALAITATATAQPPSSADANRQPVYQQPSIAPSTFDNGRMPVLQGAGSGGNLNVQSFPSQSPIQPVPSQPFSNSRPALSPYLNLFRGGNVGGLGGIDYYNFVRPAQQLEGAFIGRLPGQFAVERFGRGMVDQATADQDYLNPAARPAGTPSAFMNTGGYFNRMGSIGMGVRPAARNNLTPGRR